MTELSPESLLQTWLGDQRNAVASAIFGDPFYVPYDHLSGIDGWAIWLGHPPVPDELLLLPVPGVLLWDEPATAVATAMLVAADYAIRRGATDRGFARRVLEKECPVAIVVPDLVHGALATMFQNAVGAGVPVLFGRMETESDLVAAVPSFHIRREAHSVDLGRAHDPALSFQTRFTDVTIGGNSLSAFVVHNEPERDDVTITGKLDERIAIEIGLSGPGISLESTAEIEHIAATIPSFLDGITSILEDHSLKIGWRDDDAPDPKAIGGAFDVWLKALTGATVADVRIAFAPAKGRSTLIAEMSARAYAFRDFRSAAIAGAPDPLASAAGNLRFNRD
jgi:hypothetical protein